MSETENILAGMIRKGLGGYSFGFSFGLRFSFSLCLLGLQSLVAWLY